MFTVGLFVCPMALHFCTMGLLGEPSGGHFQENDEAPKHVLFFYCVLCNFNFEALVSQGPDLVAKKSETRHSGAAFLIRRACIFELWGYIFNTMGLYFFRVLVCQPHLFLGNPDFSIGNPSFFLGGHFSLGNPHFVLGTPCHVKIQGCPETPPPWAHEALRNVPRVWGF